MLSCSVDNDPSLSYFSLAIPSNSGYEVEEVVVWINPDFSWFYSGKNWRRTEKLIPSPRQRSNRNGNWTYVLKDSHVAIRLWRWHFLSYKLPLSLEKKKKKSTEGNSLSQRSINPHGQMWSCTCKNIKIFNGTYIYLLLKCLILCYLYWNNCRNLFLLPRQPQWKHVSLFRKLLMRHTTRMLGEETQELITSTEEIKQTKYRLSYHIITSYMFELEYIQEDILKEEMWKLKNYFQNMIFLHSFPFSHSWFLWISYIYVSINTIF